MFNISWVRAMSWAGKLVPPGPQISRARAQAATNVVAEVAPNLTALLAEITELPAETIGDIKLIPVDRERWIYRVGRTIQNLVSPAPANKVMESQVNLFKGLAMATMTGIVATRANAYCDPTIPGEPIYVVVPNVVSTRNRKSLDFLDFVQWVGLRSALYCVQFRMAPWLRTYITELITRVMSALAVDDLADLSVRNLWSAARNFDRLSSSEIADTVEPIRRTMRSHGYTQRVSQEKKPDRAEQIIDSPDETELMVALTELNQVLELMSAYMRLCMETLTPLEISSIQRIRVAMRMFPPPLELAARGVSLALGIDPLRQQSENTLSFFRSVRLWGGMEVVNQVFAGPEFLPTDAELDNPTLWWQRITNNPLS